MEQLTIGLTDSFLTMFIEVARDFVEDALNHKDDAGNVSLGILSCLAVCAQQGKHYVYVPCLRTPDLMRRLKDSIGKQNVAKLAYTNRHNNDAIIIKKQVSTYALVTYGHDKPDDRCIIIQPHRSNLDFSAETHLLAENLIDTNFYQYTLDYYKRENRFRNVGKACYALNGGGVTTASVLEKEIRCGKHFCLVIADSDKKHPTDHIGQTAKGLVDLMDEKPYNCCCYVLEKVMEIENLIPKHIIYMMFNNCDRQKVILEKNNSFFDMKKGLHTTDLYDDNCYAYWREILGPEHDIIKNRDSFKREFPNEQEYQREARKNNTEIEGFGSNLLKKVMGQCNDMNINLKEEIKHSMCNVEEEQLSDEQKFEWNNIGHILFSWTCAARSM